MMEQFVSMRVPGHFYGPLNFHYTLAIGISYSHCYGTLSVTEDRHCRLSEAKVEEGGRDGALVHKWISHARAYGEARSEAT